MLQFYFINHICVIIIEIARKIMYNLLSTNNWKSPSIASLDCYYRNCHLHIGLEDGMEQISYTSIHCSKDDANLVGSCHKTFLHPSYIALVLENDTNRYDCAVDS